MADVINPFLQPVKSAVDYENDFARADALKNQNALQGLQLRQAAAVDAQKNALRTSGLDLSTDAGQNQALMLAPDVAPGVIKTVQDTMTSRAKAQADLGSANASNATAGKTNQETQIAAHQQRLQQLAGVNTPDDALQWMLDGVKDGSLPKAGLQQGLAALQAASASPQAFAQWKQQTLQTGQTIQQQMEFTAPKPMEMKLGNRSFFVDTNPNSPTHGQQVTPTEMFGVSPDTVATQAGENSRAAADRQTRLTIAGMNPDGSVSPNIEAEAQMIAAGKAPPPTGMAATRPAAAALMARVSQINPDYDATTYGAKAAAAKGFTSGQQGNALRSISTANEHLGQLDALGDALNNGNIPAINAIGNAYGVQTGAAPAQVFNAVKNVVAQEVVKAIVAGGGSAGERDEAAKAFNSASSPAQLKQTIAAYRTIMGAQKANLLEQRRAAGLPDSTLPKYGASGAPSATAPAATASGATVSNW